MHVVQRRVSCYTPKPGSCTPAWHGQCKTHDPHLCPAPGPPLLLSQPLSPPASDPAGLSGAALAAAVIIPIAATALIGVGLYRWHRKRRMQKAMDQLAAGQDVQLAGRPFRMYDRVV